MHDRHLWGLALAISLLLHVGLLLGALSWSRVSGTPAPVPPLIEGRLVAAPAAKTPPAQPPMRPPRREPLPAMAPEPLPEAAVTDELIAADPVSEIPESVAEPAAEPVADTALEAPLPVLNALPPRIDMRFQVRYGFASGEQTLLWVSDGTHYTLTSVAAATGLVGVFYSGRFVQTSRGRITPQGLQPEEFWDQRADRRSSARFDAAHSRYTLTPASGPPRHFDTTGDDPQDALSLFFQFALTAPPTETELAYTVFNGRKLRNYVYTVRGEDMLETALGTLRTLHLVRQLDGDGRFEIWLAIDRHYLPVRVLRSDDKGNEVELRVQSIAP
ncbi:MAG: DUF3108 domain-containing protein [Thiobacillus sp.]|uniref:DUF3108 domain-containing protein n=1 Tax=Thiobacillus sp. TaxID=924 RepID=UPI00273238BA|nr:DUF3108 domain-containing protein [Thiobacillus sp.]MDP3585504.1 DUF3108 domain-containing protein [Thiobacillus sp.]